MLTNNLREALQSANLQPDDLAELIGVDSRTVRRWLSGKTPYPRHRVRIARALELTEEAVWPDLPPASQHEVRDLLAGYPSAEQVRIPSPHSLVQQAQERIELLDETLTDYLLADGLTQLLIQKARDGVQVRIMIAKTTRQLTYLLGHSGIEMRIIEPDEHQALHRYDNQMLVHLPLAGERDDPPPLIHIRRKGTGGIFDRLSAHYEDTWENASLPLHSKTDIATYLSEDELQADERDAEDLSPSDELVTESPLQSPPARAPRHWPRQPS